MNDVDVTALPYYQRRKLLEKFILPEPHSLEIVPQQLIKTEKEVFAALDAAILNRYYFYF